MNRTRCVLMLLLAVAPASCVSAAEPALREIAPRLSMTDAIRLPAGTQGYQRHPAIAFGGGVYLVCWQDGYNGLGGNSDILAMRFDSTGRPLDAEPIAVCRNAGVQDSPAVAFCDGRFLVAWSDLRNETDYDVRANFVSGHGKVDPAAEFLLAGGKGGQANPAVTGNGADNFYVVWQDFRGGRFFEIYGARVAAKTGKLLDAGGKLAMGRGEVPAVAWTGSKYLVCQKWYGALIGPDAVAATVSTRLWTTKTVLFPAVAVAWGKPYVFFNTEPNPDPWGWGGNGAIIGVTVAEDGTSPENATSKKLGRKLSAAEADGKVVNCIDAARWRGYKGWPMGRPGGFKGTEQGTWPSGRVAAAFNGRSLLLVWNRANFADRYTLKNRDLYLIRLAENWKRVDARKIKLLAGPTDEVHPVLAAGPRGDALLAYEKQLAEGGVAIELRLLKETGAGGE